MKKVVLMLSGFALLMPYSYGMEADMPKENTFRKRNSFIEAIITGSLQATGSGFVFFKDHKDPSVEYMFSLSICSEHSQLVCAKDGIGRNPGDQLSAEKERLKGVLDEGSTRSEAIRELFKAFEYENIKEINDSCKELRQLNNK